MSYFAGYKVYFYIVLFYLFCKICICIFCSLISYMELIYHTSTTNYSYRQTKLMTYKLITQSLYSQILDVPLNMSIHLPSLPFSVIYLCFMYACRYSGVVRISISFDYPSSLITYINIKYLNRSDLCLSNCNNYNTTAYTKCVLKYVAARPHATSCVLYNEYIYMCNECVISYYNPYPVFICTCIHVQA